MQVSLEGQTEVEGEIDYSGAGGTPGPENEQLDCPSTQTATCVCPNTLSCQVGEFI